MAAFSDSEINEGVTPPSTSSSIRRAIYRVAWLLFAAASACGKDVVFPEDGIPASIQIVGGNNQTGVAGSPLPDPLSVRVADSEGRPVVSGRVAFVPVVGAQGASLTPDTAVTDAEGKAVSQWQLGSVAGAQVVQARVILATSQTPLSADISATAMPGPADPDASTANVPDGAVFATTIITVQLKDEFGNLLTSGGDGVTMEVSGANPVGSLPVVDKGDGTYQSAYTPIFSGDDFVTININSSPIKDSPFKSVVS